MAVAAVQAAVGLLENTVEMVDRVVALAPLMHIIEVSRAAKVCIPDLHM